MYTAWFSSVSSRISQTSHDNGEPDRGSLQSLLYDNFSAMTDTDMSNAVKMVVVQDHTKNKPWKGVVNTSLPKKKKEKKKKKKKNFCILNVSVVFVLEAVGKDRGKKNATAEQRIYKTKTKKRKMDKTTSLNEVQEREG